MRESELTTMQQVAVDLENEQLRPVVDVAAQVLGKRPSKPTIWRWCRKGNRGERLEAAFISNKWRTTRAAFIRFLERQTAAQLEEPKARVPKPVCDASDEVLVAEGLL